MRKAPCRWGRKLAGNRIQLVIRVVLHCMAGATVLAKCVLSHRMADVPGGRPPMNVGFALFLVVFVTILPSIYLYAVYRLVSPATERSGLGEKR